MDSDSRFGNIGTIAIGRLDQSYLDVLVGIDLVEPEGDDAAYGTMQFRRKLGTGRAGTDDRDVKLARPNRFGLRVREQASIYQAAIETLCLFGSVDTDCVFAHARRAEIIADASNCNDQRVIANGAFRRNQTPIFVAIGCKVHQVVRAIEADHFTETVSKSMPVRVREIIDLVSRHVHAARGNLM